MSSDLQNYGIAAGIFDIFFRKQLISPRKHKPTVGFIVMPVELGGCAYQKPRSVSVHTWKLLKEI